MNKFVLAELSGRTLFEEALKMSGITDYEFTTRFSRVDVLFTAGTQEYCGEIKYRSYPSTTSFFEKEGCVLEKTKYDNMKALQDEYGYTPVYIHIFSDKVIAMYDLTDHNEPTWVEEEKKYGKTTMADKTKVRKVVTYLPLHSASNITKIRL